MDRCRHIYASGTRVYVPGCMGGAVYGISGCTCQPAPVRHNAKQLEELSNTCDRLADAVKELAKEVKLFRKPLPAAYLGKEFIRQCTFCKLDYREVLKMLDGETITRSDP